MAESKRDENFVTTLIGVSSVDLATPTLVAVNPTTGAVITETTLSTVDIEIGAVEIKNSTDDTRATVGANGLYVDIRASVLPTGAATAANQSSILTELGDKLDEATFTGRIGEVQASPTANTSSNKKMSPADWIAMENASLTCIPVEKFFNF